MTGSARCPQCGGYPPEHQRLTVPRAVTGDLVFCGYQCYQPWAAAQLKPAPAPGALRHLGGRRVAETSMVHQATGQQRCRSCAEPIVWGRTENGRPAPFNVSDGQNHFVTCPQRREWKKTERPQQTSFLFDEPPPAAPNARRPWDA